MQIPNLTFQSSARSESRGAIDGASGGNVFNIGGRNSSALYPLIAAGAVLAAIYLMRR